ncbi:MAG: tRNA (N6-isopentenyl adenosine(37)-C2)-methylthiotransferase MiaB [Acidobacteriota bacterium]|nr:tRNA (N6-isopentenyl adenosine(37)-C2)-methylthiotransferase MiaB [Acidobacteriota bacterium]MDQ3417813.1 tRNA (N6-isopentenyl adenosine(37)-C2)-methylthiotransferase MiaB [Acidobacteriota bacterium]
MARKYLIETFGCQMNFHDSERMAGLLEQAGYEATKDEADADVIVINTCSVREKAEDKLFTRLGEIHHAGLETGERPIVAVAGCVAQQEGDAILQRSKAVDVIIGTQNLKRLPMLVDGAVQRRESGGRAFPSLDLDPLEDISFPLGLAKRHDSFKAYVTIIEGCNEFCAFCVVPYTRGKERMRPVAEIVADARNAVGTGAREIQLLGQIVNHYQAPDDPSCDFARLLERLNEIDGLERIRFASPHPRHVTPRMIDALRTLPKVCRHLHLPVQSGSTDVLRAMRRRHTREEYLDLVARLRDAMPDIALSTDMIVGFPGERPEDFEQTLSLTETVRYHSMFSFKYSPRPNTLALKRMPDDVAEAEKTRRIVELQALQGRIQMELYLQALGRVEPVLVDARSRRREWELSGRTPGNTIVNFSGDPSWIGRTVPVRITGANPNSLRGEAVT